MTATQGVVTQQSTREFDATLECLRAAIATRGLRVFLDLDQQAAAQSDGATMPRGQLILFGRPKAGTPILVANPEAGIELPVKVYVWEAANGSVFVSYADAAFVAQRFALSEALAAPLAGVAAIVHEALAKV